MLADGRLKDFTADDNANKYVIDNPDAFLIGVILDQGIRSEQAWSGPYRLQQRLGHMDFSQISNMEIAALVEIMKGPPAIHRHYRHMAKYIHDSCKVVAQKYGGKASNLWSGDITAAEVQRRFDELPGIGHKKAAMATAILCRNFEISLRDRSGIDVAYDIHVRRVLLRAGLSPVDSLDAVLTAARTLNPEYPAALDLPAWYVGRTWCRPHQPNCGECPLSSICRRIGL